MQQRPFTLSELRALGLTPNGVQRLCAAGRLRRLRHGMYTFHTPLEQPDDGLAAHRALIAATRPAVDPTNVISHTSAAVLRELPVRKASLERVTMTRQSSGHGDAGPHLRVRNTRILPFEIEEHEHGLITTLPRTVADVARLEPMAWGLATTDAALRQGLDLGEVLEILGMHHRLKNVRRAAAVMEMADGRSESPLESISRFNIRLAGLPEPELQVEHFDADGVFVARSDFFWREFGVAGECHGKHKFTELLEDGDTTELAIERALQRGQALRRMGVEDVNWTWAVAQSPASLRSHLEPVLRRRGWIG